MGRDSRTQGRARRLRIIRKIPLRGYGQVPRIVARSWPVTQGLPLALKSSMRELSQQTLGSNTLFKTVSLWYIGRVGPKAKPGPDQLKEKGTKPQRVTPTVQDFRKNARHLMCDLTTTWIFRKCTETSVRTYHNMDFLSVPGNHRGCHYTTSSLTGRLREA